MTLHLSDAETLEICRPMKQGAAMVRYLRRTYPTLRVERKPSGLPLVLRKDFENMNAQSANDDGPRWGKVA